MTGSLGALSLAVVRVADAAILFADSMTVVGFVTAGVSGTVVKSAGIVLGVAGIVVQVVGIVLGVPGTVLGVAGTVTGVAGTCTVAGVAGTVVVVDGTVVKVIGAVLADMCTELVGTGTFTWNVFLITAALMPWRPLNLCFR